MSRKDIILIGAGGHARSCIDVIEQEGKYRIVGLVGQNNEIGKQVHSYEVLSDDSQLLEIAKRVSFALITVGQIRTPETRIRLFQNAKNAGFALASIRSPLAYVSSNATVGEGSIIMHGALVNSGARIGRNCIVNSNSLIEHDSRIADNCHVSTGALINGNVTVETGSFIGSGSILKEGISVGENSIIGMGMSITHDQESGTRLMGNLRN